MNMAIDTLGKITTAFANVLNRTPSNKVLEFDENFITECVETGKPIFEWDGTKGLINEYTLVERAGDWKLKIVAAWNTPRHGIVVAVPTGRRTAMIYKKSKVRDLRAMGMSEVYATIYLSRSRNIRYNMEPEVIHWVHSHYLMPQADLDAIGRALVPKAAAQEKGYTVQLPQSRFNFALEIVRNLRKGDPVVQFASDHVFISSDVVDLLVNSDNPALRAEFMYGEHGLSDAEVRTAISLIVDSGFRVVIKG